MAATPPSSGSSSDNRFAWQVQPLAAKWVKRALNSLIERSLPLHQLSEQMLLVTGTRMVDWIDHLVLDATRSSALVDELESVGYERDRSRSRAVLRHLQGMFPPILVEEVDEACESVAIRCDAAETALAVLPTVLDLPVVESAAIVGPRGGMFRRVVLDISHGVALQLVERHGYDGFDGMEHSAEQLDAAVRHLDAFRHRERHFETLEKGFDEAQRLIRAAIAEIGADWACDLFFTAERECWMARNQAGQVQYGRQNQLGLGWANHDHHTFRSSRAAFPHLIATLELMGFRCRERFYAGREAGWGAQVLEQPKARITIFADVDLSPEEVAGDFAHGTLPERRELGTVGLWCALHGEAFLQAGMHHLECQFDFAAARDQLAATGVASMAPFTDFDYLRQAFTIGEMWRVDPKRIDQLVAEGSISTDEADRFRRDGAVGSHLEILERNDGYKGFNQTGISEIIARTDPRRLADARA